MLRRVATQTGPVLLDPGEQHRTPIYVHAKICIVDDTDRPAGSDNFKLDLDHRQRTHLRGSTIAADTQC
jgi:hypothetical protein